MAEALIGCAAVLLVVAGVAKMRRPQPAVPMIRTLLPGLSIVLASRAVRLVAAAEVGVGVAALVIGGRVGGVLLLVMYLVLLAVAVRAARSHGAVSCGCFGTATGGAGAQVVLDVACVGAAAWAVARPPGTLAGVVVDAPLTGVLVLAQSVLLIVAVLLVTVRLPELHRIRRETEQS